MKTIRLLLVVSFVLSTVGVFAQNLETALKIKPMQKGVEYDEPTADELAQCEFKQYEKSGYVVLGPQKNILRLFLDSTGSGRVNQWSYFRNGVEVYRDIDSDGNGKADQYRWLNNAGTRWGIDTNEDGVIDSWKAISAEEVSQEVMGALASNDVGRFLRVTLSAEELKSLGLGEMKNDVVAKKIAAFQAGFAEAVKTTNFSGKSMEWYQFAGGMPGLVPAGDKENKKDLVVYENTTVMVGDGTETKQLAIGTLVKIGDGNWRTIDVPRLYDENNPMYTMMVPADGGGRVGMTEGDEIARLAQEYQEIQEAIPAAPVDKRPEMHREVTRRIIQIIALTPPGAREPWIQELASTIMAAVQLNEFPQGAEQLKSLYDNVKKQGNEELAAFVRFCLIMTDYHIALMSGEDALVMQVRWKENLEEFVTEYEKTDAGVEGMMQLAFAESKEEDSLKWYRKVVTLAADKPIAAKAKGAILRLTSRGKEIPFSGKDPDGAVIDIASMKGSFVLLYFWDSHSTVDIPAIKGVVNKYAGTGLKVIGVNVDADAQTMKATMARNQITWPQIFSPGGLDSPAPVYWGISAPRWMILYDKDGTVINPNIFSADQLDTIMGGLAR